MLNFDFTGKVAVLTGAASGMGFLTAKSFVQMGGSVVMADLNGEALAQKVEEINGIREGSAAGVVCDVRDYAQICAVRDRAMEVFGRIDLAVPYAGGAELRMLNVGNVEFPDVPIEVYDWSIDVNLRGQFYLAHAVSAVMREQRSGVIVNVGSITGEEGSSNNIGYATTKSAAMNGLTKSLALYGAKYGFRCVCVAPGPVLTRDAMANMSTAMGRAADPEEIVELVLFLASDHAAFITGINVLADGGRNLMIDKRSESTKKKERNQ